MTTATKDMRSAFLPYSRQTVTDDDIAAVVAVLRSDYLTCGPAVAAFEQQFAAVVGARHAIAVSSGTAALHAAVAGLHLQAGEEVIVPPLTFVATANCVRYCGGRVVFADVRRDTLTLDPERVATAITPRTRAIIAVDFAGCPADYGELRTLASRRRLALIADACHSLGATYRGQPSGRLADISVFSLHAVKHVAAGEGGVVTTDDDATADFVRAFRSHGIAADFHRRSAARDWTYDQTELGFNYRLTDIQCALAGSQLRRLEANNQRRRGLVGLYREALRACAAVELPVVPPDRESAWHLFPVRLRLERLRAARADVFRALRAQNIGVNVHYIPVPRHSYYRRLGYNPSDFPVAESEYERLLSLPLWPGMNEADVRATTAALRYAITFELQAPWD